MLFSIGYLVYGDYRSGWTVNKETKKNNKERFVHWIRWTFY